MDDSAARDLATRIAEDTGCGPVDLRPDRVALFQRDDALFALVPGGEVTVGYETIVCGGDGGAMICGGSGFFLGWLGLATS